MKGTRPLNNDEIRRVSTCFTGTFEVRNRWLCSLLVIVGLFIGCGGDTDTADTADTVMLVEVKPARVRSGTGIDKIYDKWYAEIDVVFEGIPADLESEFELKTPVKKPFSPNWEQTRNIVTLHFEFRLLSIKYWYGPTSAGELILGREDQKQSVEVTLAWSDGRKIFTVEAFPPESMFVGRSDIFDF